MLRLTLMVSYEQNDKSDDQEVKPISTILSSGCRRVSLSARESRSPCGRCSSAVGPGAGTSRDYDGRRVLRPGAIAGASAGGRLIKGRNKGGATWCYRSPRALRPTPCAPRRPLPPPPPQPPRPFSSAGHVALAVTPRGVGSH
ncbi:unnamed protein product, partial [Iphiclides podalirius]